MFKQFPTIDIPGSVLNTRNIKSHKLLRLCSSILMKDLFAVSGQYLGEDSSVSSTLRVFWQPSSKTNSYSDGRPPEQTVILTVVLQEDDCKLGGSGWSKNELNEQFSFQSLGVKGPTWPGRDHLTRRFPAGWISSVSQCARLKLKGRISFDTLRQSWAC